MTKTTEKVRLQASITKDADEQLTRLQNQLQISRSACLELLLAGHVAISNDTNHPLRRANDKKAK